MNIYTIVVQGNGDDERVPGWVGLEVGEDRVHFLWCSIDVLSSLNSVHPVRHFYDKID